MYIYTEGGAFVRSVWEYGVLITMFLMFYMGFRGKWTSRKCTYMMSFFIGPLLSWAIPLFLPIHYQFIPLAIVAWITLKCNRADSKDLLEKESHGITAVTYGRQRAQKEKWDVMSENERDAWLKEYEKKIPPKSSLFIILLLVLVPLIISNILIYLNPNEVLIR